MSLKLPVYLDYSATTPVDPRVAEKMCDCLTMEGHFGNPASRSHPYGWDAEKLVEEAPSIALDDTQRQTMGRLAVEIAKRLRRYDFVQEALKNNPDPVIQDFIQGRSKIRPTEN